MSFIDSPQRFASESRRLASVERYDVFGSLPEDDFDKMTRLTADVLQTPICLLTIVGETDIWIKSQIGLDVTSLPRANSFCLAVVETGMPLVIPDASVDARFCDHFMVREFGASFYACQSASKRDPLSACKRGPPGGVAPALMPGADFALALA